MEFSCANLGGSDVMVREPMVCDDLEWLEEFAKTRSEAAFHNLVDPHVDMVYAVALRSSGNHALAQEVCQQTFIALSSKAAFLVGHRSLRAWLFRVARNAAIDAIRKDARRARVESKAAEQRLIEMDPDPDLK